MEIFDFLRREPKKKYEYFTNKEQRKDIYQFIKS